MYKRLITISAALFFLTTVAFSHSFTVVYTGNTHASLYPCGECPATVGGGVERRSHAVKDILAKEKNVLLVDSGNFTAGGIFDNESVNPNLDKARSLINYEAMNEMKYDAAGIAEAEYNFGEEFLKSNAKASGINLVCANIAGPHILPYLIKEFEGFKVGITALASEAVYKKSGIEVADYLESLKSVIEGISKDVEAIVLLSSLGSSDNERIAKEFPQVSLIVTSGLNLYTAPHIMVQNTPIVTPSQKGRAVRMVKMEVKEKKLEKWAYDEKRLGLDAGIDLELSRKVPTCFKDSDCTKKDNMAVRCQEPGTQKAKCAYYEAELIEATAITDKNCPLCSIDYTLDRFRENFLGIDFSVIDYRLEEARELISTHNVKTLPCFILSKKIEKEKMFPETSEFLEKSKDKYLATREISGVFLYLERKEQPKKIDFFLDFYEKNALGIFNELAKFAEKNPIDLEIHFVMPGEKVSGYPQEEIKVALAVKKAYPKKFLDYISGRLVNIQSVSWVDTVEDSGIDYKKIKKEIKKDQVFKDFTSSQKIAKELGVNQGNVILIKNNRIFKVFAIDQSELAGFFLEKRN
ncbi:MAG: hypothetical protein ABH872_03865 [Candidatus Omnitrophota bacterium]